MLAVHVLLAVSRVIVVVSMGMITCNALNGAQSAAGVMVIVVFRFTMSGLSPRPVVSW